jgi:16S rRNA (guanine966-N2)-methyltransferase
MRIIAGKYGSRKIETRKSSATRPTLDKVREAVFSALGGSFDGGSFLDLYAGSGANGFEAVSRGMDEAVFADISHEAIGMIRKNANALGCSEQCRILPMNDMKALSLLSKEGKQFDYVYLDPPYAKQHNERILAVLDENHLMKDQGTCIIESAKEDPEIPDTGRFHLIYRRIYGISAIAYYRFEE